MPLEADPATTTLLSGPDTANLDWQDLLSARNRYDSGAWPAELDELCRELPRSPTSMSPAGGSREQVLNPDLP